jgi:hypothetical protein
MTGGRLRTVKHAHDGLRAFSFSDLRFRKFELAAMSMKAQRLDNGTEAGYL